MTSKRFVAAILGGCATLAISSEALAVDLAQGQRVYNMHCAVCHGMNGIPVIQQAPSFSAKERLMQPDMVLLQSVKMGKMQGAQYRLDGSISSIVKKGSNIKDVYYKMNLRLIEIETGIVEWSDEKDIRKTAKR